ncbi:MAG: hypothetical protein MK160_01830 [Rhodobacteraceae bacterium]|nr:hypothetical protein [Paracoccaceae bacterium]
MHDDRTAFDVAHSLLDRTGAALMARDCTAFANCFHLPHELECSQGRRLVRTDSEMRDHFDEICAYYASIGLTRLVRHVVEARFRDAGTIVSTHETRLLCHENQLSQQSYPVLSVLRLASDTWRIAAATYGMDSPLAHVQVFSGSNKPVLDS